MFKVAEGLGRLAYGVAAAEELRPLLGPLLRMGGRRPSRRLRPGPGAAPDPGAFLEGRIEVGSLRSSVSMVTVTPPRDPPEPDFRADAKAEGEDVMIGGWECADNTPPGQARWFSVRVTRKSLPWIYARGEPYRSIATLELLGVLLSIVAFGKGDRRASGCNFSGLTDNQGNAHVVAKLMTTRFPLSQSSSKSPLTSRGSPTGV